MDPDRKSRRISGSGPGILLGAASLIGCVAGWLCISFADPVTLEQQIKVEWQLASGTVLTASAGPLGTTGVTVELRETPTAHGSRYDVRLRNRTGTAYTHTALRVRLPRAGTSTQATIEDTKVALPAEVHQWWERSPLAGTQYGFAYAITSGTQVLKRVGPSTLVGQWGGRTNGIVRIDGQAYVIPEFWERQPRRITVTAAEVILTLFEGSEPLRAGEDAWDRFAILGATLTDDAAVAEAEALPSLATAARQALMARFGIAPEDLRGPDPDAEAWLRQYDRWQGTSWDKAYATDNSFTLWAGEEDSTKTTLFSLFRRGDWIPVTAPATYTWRDYGDIQWGEGMSTLHYDWLRAALKHYLKTGSVAALRWGMAAMQHAVSVDHIWASPGTPAVDGGLNLAGFARFEFGDHGTVFNPGYATHSWVEGLFLAAAITGDPWVREAAIDMAEGDWRLWGGSVQTVLQIQQDPNTAMRHGELRGLSWPMLVLVTAFRETGTQKYWTKAKELMDELLRLEELSGGSGYVKNTDPAYAESLNDALTLQHVYLAKGVLAFADTAMARGEWTAAYEAFVDRVGTWLTTPLPNGPYTAPTAASPGTFATLWCPPGESCGAPTSPPAERAFGYNAIIPDLFAWLAARNPAKWTTTARLIFKDYVYRTAHPDPAIVGYLTNQYPGAETKLLGWMQLFGDRAANWLSGYPRPFLRPAALPRPETKDRRVQPRPRSSVSSRQSDWKIPPGRRYPWDEGMEIERKFDQIVAFAEMEAY